MRIKNLFAMLLILICYGGLGQNVTTGEVMAVIQLGGQSYSVIHEDGTENYYKTSPHLSGCLVQGQAIELEFGSNGNTNTVQVLATSLNEPLFCELITINASNSQ